MTKYTLDRIEDGFYVFLSRVDESDQILVPSDNVKSFVREGDIVEIYPATDTEEMKIVVLEEETKDMKEKVSSLLDKLKNKK